MTVHEQISYTQLITMAFERFGDKLTRDELENACFDLITIGFIGFTMDIALKDEITQWAKGVI